MVAEYFRIELLFSLFAVLMLLSGAVLRRCRRASFGPGSARPTLADLPAWPFMTLMVFAALSALVRTFL
jgi:hypothetical protein